MKTRISVKYHCTMRDLQARNDLQLVDLSQDVNAIKKYFGNNKALDNFGGFMVKIENGDYAEVYGFTGNIPYLIKDVYKITMTIK